MSDAPTPAAADEVEIVAPDGVVAAPPIEPGADPDTGLTSGDSVTEPAKVMRIGSMVKLLLEEVRAADLDEASRERLAEVYERSVIEVSDALSPDLQEELRSLSLPFDHEEVPSEAELRVAKAQLVGWLEGLFHGIQASLMAQQIARQQTPQLTGPPAGPQAPVAPDGNRPGTYL